MPSFPVANGFVYYLWRPNLADEADNHLVELGVPLAQISLFHATCEIFAQVNCISLNFAQFPQSNF